MILISIYNSREPERSMYERLLYKLLQERKPHQNISHKEMPTYDNHVKFIRSKPYKEHYLIYKEKPYTCLGSVYLTKDNEIGLFLFDEFQQKGYGSKVLKTIMKKYKSESLYANIAPNNYKSIIFFKNHGFHYYEEHNKNSSQYTYAKLGYLGRKSKEPAAINNPPAPTR